MPQLPDIDDFPFVAQEEDSLACVPACVDMVCQYLGIDKDRDEIDEELGYSVDVGTGFPRVGLLSGLLANYERSFEDAAIYVDRGLPVIAHIWIEDPSVLGYCADRPFLHAVTVVCVEAVTVGFFDPDSVTQRSTSELRSCRRDDFERAWIEGWVLEPLP
jgi:hypothetical protein